MVSSTWCSTIQLCARFGKCVLFCSWFFLLQPDSSLTHRRLRSCAVRHREQHAQVAEQFCRISFFVGCSEQGSPTPSWGLSCLKESLVQRANEICGLLQWLREERVILFWGFAREWESNESVKISWWGRTRIHFSSCPVGFAWQSPVGVSYIVGEGRVG